MIDYYSIFIKKESFNIKCLIEFKINEIESKMKNINESKKLKKQNKRKVLSQKIIYFSVSKSLPFVLLLIKSFEYKNSMLWKSLQIF